MSIAPHEWYTYHHALLKFLGLPLGLGPGWHFADQFGMHDDLVVRLKLFIDGGYGELRTVLAVLFDLWESDSAAPPPIIFPKDNQAI